MVDYVNHWRGRTEIPAKQILQWIGLYESTFYKWCRHYGKEYNHNGAIPRDHWIEDWERDAIIRFHFENPLDGYRRLAFMMLDHDIVAVSPATVYRVLSKEGLLNRHTPRTRAKGSGFDQPAGPHRHWHVDVAHLNICGTFYFMATVIDGYSRYVVHWEIREQMKEIDIEAILQRAKEKFPLARPRIVTDNGPQFVSKDFKQFVRISGMTHVRTSPYYPQSNGKIERYHRTIKHDCIRAKTPLTLEDARRVVDEFVQTYNEKRLHSGIGYVTPADMLAGRAKEIHEARDRKLAEARDRRRAGRQNARAAVGTSYTDSAQSEDKALPGGNLSAELGPKSEGMAVAP